MFFLCYWQNMDKSLVPTEKIKINDLTLNGMTIFCLICSVLNGVITHNPWPEPFEANAFFYNNKKYHKHIKTLQWSELQIKFKLKISQLYFCGVIILWRWGIKFLSSVWENIRNKTWGKNEKINWSHSIGNDKLGSKFLSCFQVRVLFVILLH